ncbi:MAG: hypothetical protein M3Q08_02595 [Pseudomonadota bacterium]|nr:hypothetical protein [Pseudomonadota bacterium]
MATRLAASILPLMKWNLIRGLFGLAALSIAGCSPQSAGALADEGAEALQPASRGLDPALMAEVVAGARRLPRLYALIVARHGRTLADG